MNVPKELHYSTDHEWVRVEGNRLTIGITDYAQDVLGDVVFVELPTIGDTITAGSSFGEVESTKSVSDLFAPIAGTVAEVNEALADKPELLNDDPYGDGWILVLLVEDTSGISELLDADAYAQLTES